MAKNDHGDSTMKVYEIGYLLVPLITEAELPEVTGTLFAHIDALGGAIISSEAPRMRDLAYSMGKSINRKRTEFQTAYFVWVKFECPSENVKALQDAFDADAKVLRTLLASTTRLVQVPTPRRMGVGRKKDAKEESAPSEVIEQEVDALIAATE